MATVDMVFEGGGAKGTAFVGALEVLFAAGHKHRRLVGTSAGAITATLLGAGYSPQEFLNAVNETVPGTGAPIFTTFLDAPQIADFGQQTINNSETASSAPLPSRTTSLTKSGFKISARSISFFPAKTRLAHLRLKYCAEWLTPEARD